MLKNADRVVFVRNGTVVRVEGVGIKKSAVKLCARGFVRTPSSFVCLQLNRDRK